MPYIQAMNIEFDPAKDEANTEKHGVSLAFGREVLRDANRLDVLDVRVAHIETRYVAYGMADGRVWVCVFTPRTGSSV